MPAKRGRKCSTAPQTSKKRLAGRAAGQGLPKRRPGRQPRKETFCAADSDWTRKIAALAQARAKPEPGSPGSTRRYGRGTDLQRAAHRRFESPKAGPWTEAGWLRPVNKAQYLVSRGGRIGWAELVYWANPDSERSLFLLGSGGPPPGRGARWSGPPRSPPSSRRAAAAASRCAPPAARDVVRERVSVTLSGFCATKSLRMAAELTHLGAAERLLDVVVGAHLRGSMRVRIAFV